MKTIPIIPESKITPSKQRMSLIIKPTEKCNFKCTFCSSTNITDEKSKLLDLDKIFQFLERYPNTETIIVNGGDPLVVPIKYYYKLIDYLDSNQLDTNISLTSNLYPFYLNPSKWTPLLTHPRVSVITSFQYGNGRLKHDNTVYTEEEFLLVMEHCNKYLGYKPNFISVVVEEEIDLAIKNVLLAKRLNVECKLNLANSSGNQKKPTLLATMYKLYLSIYKLGLIEFEYNTKDILLSLYQPSNICPISRQCDSAIRTLQPSGDYYTCGSFADDREYSIDFNNEIYNQVLYTPLQDDLELFSMNDWCIGCNLFNICNGCRKTIKEHKQHGINELHCKEMKLIEEELLEASKEYYRKHIPR